MSGKINNSKYTKTIDSITESKMSKIDIWNEKKIRNLIPDSTLIYYFEQDELPRMLFEVSKTRVISFTPCCDEMTLDEFKDSFTVWRRNRFNVDEFLGECDSIRIQKEIMRAINPEECSEEECSEEECSEEECSDSDEECSEEECSEEECSDSEEECSEEECSEEECSDSEEEEEGFGEEATFEVAIPPKKLEERLTRRKSYYIVSSLDLPVKERSLTNKHLKNVDKIEITVEDLSVRDIVYELFEHIETDLCLTKIKPIKHHNKTFLAVFK